MYKSQKFLSNVALLLSIIVYLDAVTVNPLLCPTNKIAPRRSASSESSLGEESQARTLGLIFGLNNPARPRPPYLNNLNDLQEQPQEDDADDCGDIDDYDETDLSSITRPSQNYVYKKRGHRQLFHGSYNTPSYYPDINKYRPMQTPRPPQRPQRPTYYPPIRPPFNSGGTYGSSFYQPPLLNHPSIPIKPVHENTYDYPQEAYSPGLVGGFLGQVVGFPSVRPTFADDRVTSLKKPNTHVRFPESDSYNKRRARDKQSNIASDIFGSFVDLLFN